MWNGLGVGNGIGWEGVGNGIFPRVPNQRQKHRELCLHLSLFYRFIGFRAYALQHTLWLHSLILNIGLDGPVWAFMHWCVCCVCLCPFKLICSLIPLSSIVCEGCLYACHVALNPPPPYPPPFHLDSIVCMCVPVFIFPSYLFHCDPSWQTIAQRGGSTPICHRLSPFVRPTNKCWHSISPVCHSHTHHWIPPLIT